MPARRLLFVLCLFSTPTLAADPAPWQAATDIVKAVNADIVSKGIHGIDSHAADLEKALADGIADFPPKPGPDGKAIVLADGPAESLVALAAAAKKRQDTVVHPNPYADIGLMLALYYNETKQPQEVLRVIDATFKLKPVTGAFVGLHDAGLFNEKATAYLTLKRWDDGLAADDQALKASSNDRDKARSDRGRGLFLTELERLDEATAAYQASLTLEPNNPIAMRELAYIARLKAGGPKAATEILNAAGQPVK